jgi:hypothetical protein
MEGNLQIHDAGKTLLPLQMTPEQTEAQNLMVLSVP